MTIATGPKSNGARRFLLEGHRFSVTTIPGQSGRGSGSWSGHLDGIAAVDFWVLMWPPARQCRCWLAV